ncbi:alkane 1-monooxygenase [Rhodococcus sp. D2-41]|uniref:Alkane 1-monooxygenase n=1 Tax=Speluncibacter jeojiensis TaxID=2710754 RepID=A0A9X4M471_9ACTN|nr:alkane 1-monooxygenase [Rhodococcus sp. D2-41]MDG3009528.1 alkane 1-monooxygenase [Rhodococcus sp. D2-41]MDG3016457.1 alkane 1-monooxygenase [Corynebacteriales bacterium D3-21]
MASSAPARWRDNKRYLWPLSLVAPLSPFLGWGAVREFRLGLFWAAGAIVIGVLVPLVDLLTRADKTNPPEAMVEALENDRYYRYCVYAYLPLQYAGLVFACFLWVHAPMGIPERLALASTVGVVGGIGINAAHELGHKRTKLERRLSKIALAQTFYGHFYVEHNHGHHLRVATPEDPASARYGESYWFFLPRSVIGSLRSAWRIESGRLRRRGQRIIGRHNNILNAWALSVVLFTVLIAGFGWSIAPYLMVQAGLGFSLLEAANYLEHYGLLRARRPDGTYRKTSFRDSWNSDHVCSNLFLYQLQRHSDHHANPLRRYQTLRTSEVSPQLPAGYAVMFWCAFIPPLWRRVMDHRLLDYYDHDLTRINVKPRFARRLAA